MRLAWTHDDLNWLNPFEWYSNWFVNGFVCLVHWVLLQSLSMLIYRLAHLPKHSKCLFELISNQNNFVGITLFDIISLIQYTLSTIIWQMCLLYNSIQCNNRLGNPFMHIVRFGNLLPFFESEIEQFTIWLICMRARLTHFLISFRTKSFISIEMCPAKSHRRNQEQIFNVNTPNWVCLCVCWISFVFVEKMIKRSEMLL